MENSITQLRISNEPNGLEKLCGKLMDVFEDEHVNIEEVMKVLASYKSNSEEWQKYAIFDTHRYTRNLVHEGNGKYNLMLLAWGPGMGSSIHDHADAHCFVKMLSGDLLETRFAWPSEDEEKLMAPLAITRTTELHTDEVTYMSDELGLHRVENTSHSEPACSLHLYIPAFSQCKMFDERTGQHRICEVTFWSRYGLKMPKITEKNKRAKGEKKSKNLENGERRATRKESLI